MVSGVVMLLATRSSTKAGPFGVRGQLRYWRRWHLSSARRDGVKVRRRDGVKRRQGLRWTVEAPLALEGPALVDDGDDGRPGRRAQARAADDRPRPWPV